MKTLFAIRRMFLALILAVALLSACGSALAASQIDWINFIKFDGITYVARQLPVSVGRRITEADLGPEFAKVDFKLSGSIDDRSYQSKNGDAAFLDPGTAVYTVNGYAPTFRLAARVKLPLATGHIERLTVFEAESNPRAINASALMDIDGKVAYIGVIHDTGNATNEIGAIKEPAAVEAMVGLLLKAPIVLTNRIHPGERRYFIAFHLKDGTAVRRAFWPDSGQLSWGIMTPPDFSAAVREAAGEQTGIVK